MPKRSRKPTDLDHLPPAIVVEATEDQPEKNPAAVALGWLGGKKGGPARAKKLTPGRRREIAQRAVGAQWSRVSREARS